MKIAPSQENAAVLLYYIGVHFDKIIIQNGIEERQEK